MRRGIKRLMPRPEGSPYTYTYTYLPMSGKLVDTVCGPRHQAHRQVVVNSTDVKYSLVAVVCWLLNVPVTCECVSGTDLHRQFYVLPH